MALTGYLQEIRRLLNDTASQFYSDTDLTAYINTARRRIAGIGQCCRFLPPSSGSLASIAVGAGGTGYSSPPTVTISNPDAIGYGFVQATATATVSGGQVNGFVITNAGTGYVNPVVTISGGGGSGATATATLTPFLHTNPNQEVYNFTTAAALIPTGAGIASIVGLQSVAVSWGAQKPVLDWIDWSAFQAYWRSYNYGTNWPVIWAQYAQGASGSVYLAPIPSQVQQMEWDCYCFPINLVDDTTVEAIPDPFTSAVKYYAARQASIGAGKMDRANYFDSLFKAEMPQDRMIVSPAMVPSFYQGMR